MLKQVSCNERVCPHSRNVSIVLFLCINFHLIVVYMLVMIMSNRDMNSVTKNLAVVYEYLIVYDKWFVVLFG